MRIDKNKPLPDHTKLDYDECCALLVLKELFPERYANLEIKDKPDLQSDTIGVEVTIADDKKHQEALNNWLKAYHCEDESKKEKYIERMKQLGVTYTGGIQTWGNYMPSVNMIFEAINKKIEKVAKSNYREYDNYELFVFSDVWMHESVTEELKEYLENNDVFESYNIVYLLEMGYILHVFTRDDYRIVEIDKTEQTNRNIRAREMVELAEIQE